jgi:hypothetical protein
MTTVDNRVSLSTECEYRLNSDTLFKVVTNSQMFFLRNPSTPSLNTSNGTMLLNWFLEKNLLVVKSIHWHLLNKRNWTHSLKKTWRPVRSVHLNLQCHLQFFLSKRRTVLSTWFKTIKLLMLSLKDKYPISLISELVNKLRGATVAQKNVPMFA